MRGGLSHNRNSILAKALSRARALAMLYQKTYLRRNDNDSDPENGVAPSIEAKGFGNGTAIPDGKFRFFGPGAQGYGQPKLVEDYEIWTNQVVVERSQDAWYHLFSEFIDRFHF
jgi:hypothetical protein